MSEQIENQNEKQAESPFVAKGRRLPKFMSRVEAEAYLSAPGRLNAMKGLQDVLLACKIGLSNGDGPRVYHVKKLEAIVSADRFLAKKLEAIDEQIKEEFVEAIETFAADYEQVDDCICVDAEI